MQDEYYYLAVAASLTLLNIYFRSQILSKNLKFI